MPTNTRTAGRLGRLPARMPVGLGPLTHYAAGSLPAAPAAVAVPTVADWGMLGNDSRGDCGVAGLEHLMMADAARYAERETFASADQAVTYYLTYTDGQDSGVVLSDYLAYVRAHGYYGHTVTAYAPVSVHDVPTLEFAISAYGAAYTGIQVTDRMQTEFEQHQPWTAASLDGQILGGHCIPIVGYDSTHLYAVTWGEVQAIARGAWSRMSSEAWAVITGELAHATGIDMDALTADLDHLDGR